MKQEELNKLTGELNEKFPDVGIQSITVDEKTGKSTFLLQPNKKNLAFLEKTAIVPHVYKEKASTINRDAIQRSVLDLGASKSAYDETPENAFKRAIKYYYNDGLVGSVTNFLASMSCKGFENDIDDPNIKQFYDVWTFDVGFEDILECIFLDFFKTGHVTTYKVLAKYEPRVSYLSPLPGQKINNKKATGQASAKEFREAERVLGLIMNNARKLGLKGNNLIAVEKAAKKNIWSKGHLPVAYTVLNPLLVNIEGNLLFDKTSVKLKLPTELADLLKKPGSELTEEEKELIKALPSDLKAAAEKGGEYPLDYRLVGSVTYRKQPYEKYARPRTARIFDTVEYKEALKKADLSTLDGISNYILKVTIGSDEYPVTTQSELEAVANLFNTASKSFDVVWNHTLKIEKIVSPEIGDILGQDKYLQVNEDMTAGLAVSRALIDGVGSFSSQEAALMVKGVMEEINYARRQVTKWIYREYQQIAEAMAFERFPKVRWDEGVLKDTILYMNTIAQLVDRRMLSYETALETLGFDYANELQNMTEEFNLVQDGTFGILGSPWQKSGIQPTQNAPTGTPSSGRPPAKPSKTKQKQTNPNKQQQQKPKNPKKTASLKDVIKDLNEEEYAMFKHELDKYRIMEDE